MSPRAQLILAMCVAAAMSRESIAQRVDRYPVFVDYIEMPPTLGMFAARVETVVRGRIDGVSYDPGGQYTRYTVGVVDILKPSALIPAGQQTIPIVRVGGQATEKDRLIVSFQVGFAEFREAEEYVFFLDWSKVRNGFDIAYGPGGTFQIVDGVIKPLGAGEVSKAQRDKHVDAFVAEIRSFQK